MPKSNFYLVANFLSGVGAAHTMLADVDQQIYERIKKSISKKMPFATASFLQTIVARKVIFISLHQLPFFQ